MAHFKSGEAKEEVERGGREAKKKKEKRIGSKKGARRWKRETKVDPENRDMQCVCVCVCVSVHVLKREREPEMENRKWCDGSSKD